MKIGEINIGEKVFCTDVRTKEVFEAELIGTSISFESGYALGTVFNRELIKDKVLEIAHIHKTKEIAEAFMAKIKPTLENIDKEIKEITESVDKQRVEVIGEPEFKELADLVREKQAPQPLQAVK